MEVIISIPRPGADTTGDEWSGISDPKLRRKLQNRCNQRAARRRRRAAKASNGASRDQDVGASDNPGRTRLSLQIESYGVSEQDHAPANETRHTEQVARSRVFEKQPLIWKWMQPSAEMSDASCDDVDTSMAATSTKDVLEAFASMRWERFRDEKLQYHRIERARRDPDLWRRAHRLPADYLLSLVYCDVYRGLLLNIAILGLDLNLMNTDEYPSPFLPLSSSASSAIAYLPEALRPTVAQSSIAHHPQVDIFPDSVMRDNFLHQPIGTYDDDELCFDMVGSQSRLSNGSIDLAGCYIRGEPWHMSSWEFSAWFVAKYPWLFKGVVASEHSTNAWRRQRNLAPLSFSAILDRSGSQMANVVAKAVK